ncbi:MAG: 1-acyl-sn-glycerol-3-phosphate acyltransferase [Hoylesella enoeca]|uniref:1-acyl-sn-glycerol-3-phosphate acyltransferase n=1 Tax=Hoylesella enoeca TaxID=76123 RepID=UPI003FA0057F
MSTLSEFDPIRPFEPEELPEVFERLLNNEQFRKVIAFIMPEMSFDVFATRMRECKTGLEFQHTFCYGFLEKLLSKASKSCDFDISAIGNQGRFTFISNHRDIVLDSAFLDKLLIDAGFTTTCEIAIGDNLLSLPWIKDLVRINKSFIVERNLPMRQMLAASRRLSEYMHYAVNVKHENVWIAQREGRAKDSDDRTQEAVLKMMAMGGTGSAVERLIQLHIVPLTISYEFDPCDYLKAQEFQLKRDVQGWKKSPQDDLVSMQTGIFGYKGRIHYQCAPCLDNYLTQLDSALPKTELYASVATFIDRQIHRNYRLYPCNYVALDLLRGATAYRSAYTDVDQTAFEQYISGQLAKIELENKDESYLRERLLTMYANPAINYLAAQ